MADTNFYEWLFADMETLIDCDFEQSEDKDNHDNPELLKEREQNG